MYLALFVILLAWGTGAAETGSTTNSSEIAAGEVITNLEQFYDLPAEQKGQLHRVRMELLIYYSNPTWSVFWGQSGKADTFLPLKGLPIAIKSGQRILIDGWTLPVNQEIVWDKSTVTILSESNLIDTLVAKGRLSDVAALNQHFVEIEGLVDPVKKASPYVLTLSLIAENCVLTAQLTLSSTNQILPDFVGKQVRIRGVYNHSTDSLSKKLNIGVWVPGTNNVEIIGSLAQDARFSSPLITSQDFASAPQNRMVLVHGMVRSQRPKESVTLWDEVGQIQVLTQQQYPLKIGERIEAVGYPLVRGFDRILSEGLFRPSHDSSSVKAEALTSQTNLFLTEQVRQLEPESLARQPTAHLDGVVTWVNARQHFCFILDSSGGIRVMQSQLSNGRRLTAGMLAHVEGMAVADNFAPVITNAVIRQTGTITLPDAPLVSLEEAMTGTLEGGWVKMRGYVRKVMAGTNRWELNLMAPGGEFTAKVPPNKDLKNMQGSMVLVKGVCVAVVNTRHQLTRIEVWVSDLENVQIEQSALENPFGLPLRSIASLKQFNVWHSVNEPLHTYGTVTLLAPGHYLYAQDGSNSIQALSEQLAPLRLGERVELVGFAGHGDNGAVLRDAIYRTTGFGPETAPVQLTSQDQITEELNGLLVQIEGTLIDTIKVADQTHLIVQSKSAVFEAEIDLKNAPLKHQFQPGSQLALTGVFFLQRNEGAFRIQMRSEADIQLLKLPPWWTPFRLLLLLLGILLVLLVVVFRTVAIGHRNKLLQQTRDELKAARDKLEDRVEARTQELRDEVEAHKNAHDRLVEAQKRLITASRQAGMAEIATGVLHNVGNVLNSVNVSASVVADSLSRFRVEQFTKAVAMLNGQGEKLATFLLDDPRGRALPGYLRDLAQAMTDNQQKLQGEIKSLIKQIDHVKAIVSLQQNYAKHSSLNENLDPIEMMEDAVQINRAAFERHEIKLMREFASTPQLSGDRHKILQILINLLNNAKYAVKDASLPERCVTLRIRSAENKVRFEVADSGVGISPENLNRIFTLGFTTKTGGHGFGLHSGANAAKEMSGQLSVFSPGLGGGATFVLELPIAPFTAAPKPATLFRQSPMPP